ncbi:MAG: hypothetical protein IPN29_02995 [Saprospiraceae bacterium]|nr:hypothetical protein [Saprospiraceae bacterium]
MKKIFITVVFVTVSLFTYAVTVTDTLDLRPVNNINLNILGDAAIVSIKYERLILVSERILVMGKLGFGYNENFKICIFGPCAPADSYMTLSQALSCNLGKGRHFFEFGIGGTLLTGKSNTHYLLYPTLGYRLQPLKSKKLNFSLVASFPFTGYDESADILFSPIGVILGLSF